MKTLISRIKYLAKCTLWTLHGYFGPSVSLKTPQKLTVLITYFNPVRMKRVNDHIRNVLKCDFVEKLIISNHNPEVDIRDRLTISSARLTVLNQPIQRGCGFRWQVAQQFDPEYLLVIDDDFLLFPGQIRKLFECLLEEPGSPHGVSGMDSVPAGGFDFRDREDRTVDFLCEVYAVTQSHLHQYMAITDRLSSDSQIAGIINSTADFMVISQAGSSKPKIHNIGPLFRDETFQMAGIAVHKDQEFEERMGFVLRALQNHSSPDRR